MLRSSLDSVNTITPLDDVKINFDDPALRKKCFHLHRHNNLLNFSQWVLNRRKEGVFCQLLIQRRSSLQESSGLPIDFGRSPYRLRIESWMPQKSRIFLENNRFTKIRRNRVVRNPDHLRSENFTSRCDFLPSKLYECRNIWILPPQADYLE